MRKDITVSAEPREGRGKNEARRLRATGVVPAVVYGGSGEPEAVGVRPKDLTKILNSTTGHNTIFNLNVTGRDAIPVMIVDWQYEPIRDSLLHVDMKRIDLSQRLHVKVAVVTHGEARGVKQQGGLLELITREIEIECLPDDIPEYFDLDVSEMAIGDNVRAANIPLTGSMKLLSPGDAVIVHVISLKAEVVEAVESAIAGAPEPEVIKKGKKETEAAEPAKKK